MDEYYEEIELITEELETEYDLKVLNDCWHISAHPCEEILPLDINLQAWFDQLKKIGSIKNLKIIDRCISSLDEKKNEKYPGFEIDFKCDKLKSEIDKYIDPIRNNYKIRILPPNSNISDYIDLIEELSDRNLRIGEILKEIGSLTEIELEEVLKIQSEYTDSSDKDTGIPIGEILVREKMIHDTILKAALDKQKKLRKE